MNDELLSRKRLPSWMRKSLSERSAIKTHSILGRYQMNTVCESALCPNRSECYSHGTATFMLLGNVCTRRCGFCAIETGRGEAIDIDEPERVAESVAEMGLEYVVLTSVARDDLRDEGAGHIAETIRAIRRKNSAVSIEVLTPDFHARPELIRIVLNAEPTVFNHNLECVRRLQKSVRPQADYDRSLRVLETVKLLDPGMTVKSGLMLGLGENLDEVRSAVTDLRRSGCDILTLGQYLPPSVEHLPVQEYVAPSIFDALAEEFKKLGFRNVFAGPYVRSSYHAGETYLTIQGG